ncbi:MAG: preprotein translocase subunit YajC [Aristaeellaceae bacterium]
MELLYKLLGIATAVAEDAAASEIAAESAEMGFGQQLIYILLNMSPLLLVVLLMYFMMIRPERKRRKKEKAMLDALKRGDRICTIGGIYGTIMDIKDDTITLSVGRDNLSMVVARWAIRSVEDVTIENESESLN